MNNAIYFILKVLSVLNIFKFFDHVGKQLHKLIYGVTTWESKHYNNKHTAR